MKTSFSTLACPQWDLQQILSRAVLYGYDGVELRVVSGTVDLWEVKDFTAGQLASSQRRVQDAALAIPCLGTSACFHSQDAAERQRNIEVAIRMAEIAAGLGCNAIRVFPDRIQAGNTRAETQTWIADSLAQLAAELTPAGIEVWLETHGDFATSEHAAPLVNHPNSSQAIGIIWDPANAFGIDGVAPSITPAVANRIRHVHLKDLKRNSKGECEYALPGEGAFPFNEMIAQLRAIGFGDFISFEWEKFWHPKLASPEIALPGFIQWWKEKQEAEF